VVVSLVMRVIPARNARVFIQSIRRRRPISADI
jgi:hypothetical protein